MAEDSTPSAGTEAALQSAPAPARRLPAALRLFVAALLGMGVAGLSAYLMRTIGF